MAKKLNNELTKPRGRKGAPANDKAEAHDDDDVSTGALPTGDFIKQHIKSLQALHSKSRTIAAEIGAEKKNAEADHNVHKGAAAFAMKLANMDEEKREDFLRHFDSYRLQLGFGRQDDLFNDPSPAEAATFAGRAQ